MILRALLQQISKCPSRRERQPELDAQDWQWLAQSGMLSQARQCWPDIQLGDMPAEARLQISVEQRISSAQQGLVLEIHQALSAQGIEIGLLKGAVLAQSHYASPECRPMADLDLLLCADVEAKARQCMHALGFVDYCNAEMRPEEGDHHKEPLYHPVRGLWVELHTALFPSVSPCSSLAVFQRPMLGTESIEIAGCCFQVLDRPRQLLYVAAHWSQTMHSTGKFHGLSDLTLLVHDPKLDFAATLAAIEAPALMKTAAVSLEMLRRCEVLDPAQTRAVRALQRRAGLHRIRLWLFWSMTEQMVLGKSGVFPIMGRHLVAQWWLEVMRSGNGISAIARMLYRLIVPMDYGGPRGWALQKHRLQAFCRRVQRLLLPAS